MLAVGSECAVGASEHENGEGIQGHVSGSLTKAPRRKRRGKGAGSIQPEEEVMVFHLS